MVRRSLLHDAFINVVAVLSKAKSLHQPIEPGEFGLHFDPEWRFYLVAIVVSLQKRILLVAVLLAPVVVVDEEVRYRKRINHSVVIVVRVVARPVFVNSRADVGVVVELTALVLVKSNDGEDQKCASREEREG